VKTSTTFASLHPRRSLKRQPSERALQDIALTAKIHNFPLRVIDGQVGFEVSHRFFSIPGYVPTALAALTMEGA